MTDNGIGIAPAMLPHVFDMFAQADRSLERTQAGLGVGLTLARRLVELHGGTLEARSEGLGTGSEFIVRLPVSRTSRRGRRRRRRRAGGGRAGAPAHRVLVVDDNVDFATASR